MPRGLVFTPSFLLIHITLVFKGQGRVLFHRISESHDAVKLMLEREGIGWRENERYA